MKGRALSIIYSMMAFCALLGLTSTEAIAETRLDAAKVEAFADSVIKPAMQASGVPGAILTVVDRNHTIIAKGYGFANRAKSQPVSPNQTVFDVASVGKTFTSIIISQLLAEGLVDLDTDVNQYLKDVKVTGGHLTLRMLLGHRAGFDNDLSFLFVGPGENMLMSDDEIDRHLQLMRRPGKISSYDNVGFGVAGLIAEAVTGKPLPELFKERIFKPLNMTGAVYGLPANRELNFARCTVPEGKDKVKPCKLVQYRQVIWGAGGISMTAEAAGRYMRMLLNRGRLDGAVILSSRSFAKMIDFDTYRFRKGIPGLGRAFQQFYDSGKLVYGHGGSIPGFSTALRIYPDAGIGIFISFMGGQVGSFDATLSNALKALPELAPTPRVAKALQTLHGFTDRFSQKFIPKGGYTDPVMASDGRTGPSAADRPEALAGRYYGSAPPSRNLIANVLRWAMSFDVRMASPNAITIAGQGPFVWRAPFLYEGPDGRRVGFREIDDHMYMATGVSIATLVRQSWYEAPVWAVPLLGIGFLVFLTGIVHLFLKQSQPVKRAMLWSLTGWVLVIATLVLELQYGIWFAVIKGQIWLPVLWRLVLHGGIILLLMLPATFVMRVSRLDGAARIFHVGLLSLAAIASVAALAFLGVVGHFI